MKDFTNEETIISIKNLHKSFTVSSGVGGVKQLFVERRKRSSKTRSFVAIDDVSVDIKKGEFFGIVGRNGSGKSTLLKILAGVYTPTSGTVDITGILTPFIELGVGFNPELTGKDNVYLNGALLGFSRKQMDAMYSDIVEFAELEDFMHERLKNYSSGMQVRLAFSVAIKAQSDILLIDEVLAVGDTAFQNKCLNYFKKIKQDGRTVVFVTHDMGAVEKFCDRVLVLDKAKVDGIYPAKKGVQRYNYHNVLSEINTGKKQAAQEAEKKAEKAVQGPKAVAPGLIGGVYVETDGDDKAMVTAGEPLRLRIELAATAAHKKALKNMTDILCSMSFHDENGAQIAGTDSDTFAIDITKNHLTVTFPHSPFLPGVYSVYAGIYANDADGNSKLIDTLHTATTFAALTRHGNSGSGQFYFWPDWSQK